MLIAALGMFTLTACSDSGSDDDDDDLNDDEFYSYGVEKGTVNYTYTIADPGYDPEVGYWTMSFDNSGKRMRLEIRDTIGTDPSSIIIADGLSGKYYVLLPSFKQYVESDMSGNIYAAMFMYLGDELNSAWSYYANYTKKANKTIAGKSCTVFGWSADDGTFEWGGWKRITFWMYENSPGGGSNTLEATSFSESAPSASSFTIPSDYTKSGY